MDESIKKKQIYADESRFSNNLYNLISTSINCSEHDSVILSLFPKPESKSIICEISYKGRLFSQEDLNETLNFTDSSKRKFNPTTLGMAFGLPITFYTVKFISKGIKILIHSDS